MNMTKLTRGQREALATVYRRELDSDRVGTWRVPKTLKGYRAFRRTVYPGNWGCVMVPWAGMHLGIEEDGYTHS